MQASPQSSGSPGSHASERREHLPLVFEMIGHLVPAMITLLVVVLAGAFFGFPTVVVIIAVLFPAGLAVGFHMGLNDVRDATWQGEITRLTLTALIGGAIIWARQFT
jgi:hypothetical protein